MVKPKRASLPVNYSSVFRKARRLNHTRYYWYSILATIIWKIKNLSATKNRADCFGSVIHGV